MDRIFNVLIRGERPCDQPHFHVFTAVIPDADVHVETVESRHIIAISDDIIDDIYAFLVHITLLTKVKCTLIIKLCCKK